METFQRTARQLVVHPPSSFDCVHESGIAQHPQVVAEQVRRDGALGLQVAHAAAASGETAEDAKADGLGDRGKQFAGLSDGRFKRCRYNHG